ncbi:T7SS effector LXG polymorphic toxin [Enterococcus larvae]|uniref:T7SS effector LXG polymorphic toxin n=1 Tax=Enterococcus larvae TaxID=2794352 RepID=UPI003F36323F
MYLGEVRSQSNSAIQLANAYNGALGSITDSCHSFLNAPLSGKTYESAKSYFNAVYPPLVNGLKMMCEALAEAHRSFPEKFESMVDSCDVEEEKLIQQIADGGNVLKAQYAAIDALAKAEEADPHMEKSIMRTQALIAKLEEKLKNLREFNAKSASIFSNVESLQDMVNQGLASVGNSQAWNASTGTFDMGRVNLSWTKPLNEKWKEHTENKEKELEKYMDKLSNEKKAELQAQLQNTSEKEKPDVLQEFLKENGMGLVQDFSLSAIEEYFNKHGQSIAMSFYNASARNVGTEIGSALHIGGTVSKNLGKTMPLIGAAIDFVGQIADGENAVDAVNKTVLHFGAGIIIGTVIVGVGIPALPALVIGTIVGSAVSNIIDAAYDGFTEKVNDFMGDLFSWG